MQKGIFLLPLLIGLACCSLKSSQEDLELVEKSKQNAPVWVKYPDQVFRDGAKFRCMQQSPELATLLDKLGEWEERAKQNCKLKLQKFQRDNSISKLFPVTSDVYFERWRDLLTQKYFYRIYFLISFADKLPPALPPPPVITPVPFAPVTPSPPATSGGEG